MTATDTLSLLACVSEVQPNTCQACGFTPDHPFYTCSPDGHDDPARAHRIVAVEEGDPGWAFAKKVPVATLPPGWRALVFNQSEKERQDRAAHAKAVAEAGGEEAYWAKFEAESRARNPAAWDVVLTADQP